MSDPSDRLRTMTNGLDEATRLLAKAEGRREAVAARSAEIEREVGLAKGRLALRPKVDEFIEQLQEDWTRKNIEKYESLLNALHGEVFADQADENRRIVFDLSTERGLPSLDVLVEANGARDEREDVLEDNGGALTNVVGAALRIIAVVKSHTGKFLVLDEPDCWTDMARVASFYKVLTNVSKRLGIQCLVITHKDVRSLDNPSIHTARHVGFPKSAQGNNVIPDDRIEWPGGHEGFRYIRLVKVQGYVDVTIPLSPGIMAITGPNGRGKSTITRAWRAIFYGEGRASLIRHGASEATIEVGLHDGRVLRYSRARKRNPINMWSLLEADGRVVEEEGTRFETGGTLPEWVTKRFKMGLVDGLDVHISHQKKPVFLLGETASKRASVLSIGQEASYIQDMQAIQKDRCSKDQAIVREGAKEIVQLAAMSSAFAVLPDVSARLDEARARVRGIERVQVELLALERHLDRLSSTEGLLGATKAAGAAFEALPPPEGYYAIERGARDCLKDESILQNLVATDDGLRVARSKALAYAGVPERAPVLSDTDDRLLSQMVSLDHSLVTARAKADSYASLPEAAPSLVSTDRIIEVGTVVSRSDEAWRKAYGLGQAYEDLVSMPVLEPTDATEGYVAAIVQASASHAEATDRLARNSREIASVQAQVDEVLAASDGVCMTCGQFVDDPMKLLEHTHR